MIDADASGGIGAGDAGGEIEEVYGALRIRDFRGKAASPEFLYWVKNADGKDPLVAVNAVPDAYVGASGLIPGLGFAPARPGDILTIYGFRSGRRLRRSLRARRPRAPRLR